MPSRPHQTPETNSEKADRLFIEASRFHDAGDCRKAFTLYLRAAELGDSSAQLNLGNYYAAGQGTRKNPAEAARWYRKSYKAGQYAAANNLAIDQRNAGNIRSAIVWFKRAIAMNDGDAAVLLAKLYLDRKQTKLATALLKRAIGMARSDLSEYGREEAEALLKQLT